MTSVDQYNQPLGSDVPPYQLAKPHLKKRPSMFEPPIGKEWDSLSLEDRRAKLKALQQVVLRKEREILRLINLRNSMPRQNLPPGELDFAAKIFEPSKQRSKRNGKDKETSHRWVQKLMADYELYRLIYPHDASAEFFVPLPMGR